MQHWTPEKKTGRYQSSSLTNREKLREKNCDKYSQCQTLIACQLFEAAQWKDERLLLQIEDKDLVGLEVCYHCLCYNEYVPNSWQGQIHRMKHLKIKFCEEVIQKRMIQNNEILFTKSLHRKFINCVQEVEGVDCSKYRSHNLKTRLKSTFPTLVIHRSFTKNTIDFVYSQSLTAKELVQTAVGSNTLCTVWKWMEKEYRDHDKIKQKCLSKVSVNPNYF